MARCLCSRCLFVFVGFNSSSSSDRVCKHCEGCQSMPGPRKASLKLWAKKFHEILNHLSVFPSFYSALFHVIHFSWPAPCLPILAALAAPSSLTLLPLESSLLPRSLRDLRSSRKPRCFAPNARHALQDMLFFFCLASLRLKPALPKACKPWIFTNRHF